MRFLKHIKDSKGFSLAEVMVAAGLVGVLSLVSIQLTSNQVKTKKRAQASVELNTVSNTISQILLKKDACTSSLGAGTVIADDEVINQLNNVAGAKVLEIGQEIGHRTLSINNMKLQDVELEVVGPKRYGTANLEVTLVKESSLLTDSNGDKQTVIKKYPLRVEVDDATGGLNECYSATEGSVSSSKSELCFELGGIFDISADKCNLEEYADSTYDGDPNNGIYSNSVLLSTRHLHAYQEGVLDVEYVNLGGDTMSGNLIVQSDIYAENMNVNNRVNIDGQIISELEFCVDGNCTTFPNSSCDVGAMIGVNPDGSLICSNLSCPTDKFFNGLDGSGNKICQDFPYEVCDYQTEYVQKVLPSGEFVCAPLPAKPNLECADGYAINRISPEDVVECKEDDNVYSESCLTSGEVVLGFSNTGDPICGDPTAPIDGGWGPWTGWSTCSMNCGGGTETRTRQCNNPRPQYDGQNCSGPEKDTRSCNTQPCVIEHYIMASSPGPCWSGSSFSCGDHEPPNCPSGYDEVSSSKGKVYINIDDPDSTSGLARRAIDYWGWGCPSSHPWACVGERICQMEP